MATPTLSILFIVYQEELPEALFLLGSINQNFDLDTISRIYIGTQENGSDVATALTNTISVDMPKLDPYITIVTQKDIIGKPLTHNGWFIQQLLKLKISSLAESEYVLILDCKNHFVSKSSSEDFFHDSKALYTITNEEAKFPEGFSQPSLLGKCFINSFDVFGLDFRDFMDRALGSLTPFVFSSKIAGEMIHFLEKKFIRNFTDLFLEDLEAAEFYLYTAYLHSTGVFDIEVAHREQWISGVIWGSNTEDIEYVDWLQSMVKNKTLKLFGIHKQAYSRISTDVAQRVVSIWGSEDLPYKRYGYYEKVMGHR